MSYYKTILFLPIFFIFTQLSFAAPGNSKANKTLSLGVHPYLASSELLKHFNPLVNYLNSVLDINIKVDISSSYNDHIKKVGLDKYDLAYIGPLPYIKMVKKYGNKPLLSRLEKNGKPFLNGFIIIRNDSQLESVSNLRGKNFAFGDNNSTMGHIVPRYLLCRSGISLERLNKYSYLKNHQNVAMGVLMGKYDAGAVKEEVFFQYRQRGLKILSKTPSVSEHLFVASNNMPKHLVNLIRNAMLELKKGNQTDNILQAISKKVTALAPVRDKDYDQMREIWKNYKNCNP